MTRHETERRCILSGKGAERGDLIRLALSPDGAVLPDVGARAPGRGAWVTPDRALIADAEARGRLKGALARAFRGDVRVQPVDLAGAITDALRRAALDRMGLALRAGQLVTGAERVADAVDAGAPLVLHAADAAPDGVRKIEQRLHSRAGRSKSLLLPAGRDELSLALGQSNVVHAALRDRETAVRVEAAVTRWRDYLGVGKDRNADAAHVASGVIEG